MTEIKDDRRAPYSALLSLADALRHLHQAVTDEALMAKFPELRDKSLSWEALGRVAKDYKIRVQLIQPTAEELAERLLRRPVPRLDRASAAFRRSHLG